MRLLLSCQTPTSRHAEAGAPANATRKMIQNALIFSRGSTSSRKSITTAVGVHSSLTHKPISDTPQKWSRRCTLPTTMYVLKNNPTILSTGTCFVLDREVCERNTDVRYRCTRCARRQVLASSMSASLTS